MSSTPPPPDSAAEITESAKAELNFARMRKPWRAGQIIQILMALVVGLFLTLATVLGWALINVRKSHTNPTEDIVWIIFQFQVEAHQSLYWAEKLKWEGDQHADALRLRYEILLSRLSLISEGEVGAKLQALSPRPHLREHIRQRAEALEPLVDDAIANTGQARQHLAEEMRSITVLAQEYGQGARIRSVELNVEDRQQLTIITGLSLWLIGALAIAVGGVLVLILRQIRNERSAVMRQARISDELRYAKLRAEAASRAKSAFLTNMSHELRTPLNAIIGITEMTLEELQLAGLYEEAAGLQRVERAGRHLLSLINDLLDLSKIEAGKLDLVPSDFKLSDMASELQALAESLAQRFPNNFSIHNSLPDCRVRLDYMRTKQILINLLGNAFRFTESGTIHLTFSTYAGGLRVDVRDTGVGIPPDRMSSLFQDFVQLDTNRRQGGTGLGLALSRRLARMMGGDVLVSSELGKGSTFSLLLPSCLLTHTQQPTLH